MNSVAALSQYGVKIVSGELNVKIGKMIHCGTTSGQADDSILDVPSYREANSDSCYYRVRN